jgi:hypothetical protein
MSRHLNIVGIFNEFVCRPFLFAIQFREVEYVDRMAVESGFVSFDYRVVTIASLSSDRIRLTRRGFPGGVPFRALLA